MELKTVLLFAHECAPYHHAEGTIGAQRPAQFAAHLPEFGWRAIVVCCDGKRRRVAGRPCRATGAGGARVAGDDQLRIGLLEYFVIRSVRRRKL